eukprot:SAG31_NODE_8973_length_1354_cov_3.955378_2_plen_106_part_01
MLPLVLLLDSLASSVHGAASAQEQQHTVQEWESRRMQAAAHGCQQRAEQVAVTCCDDSAKIEHGCAALPDQCSRTCAPTFVAFRDDCPEMLELAGFDMRQVEQLYD